MKKIVFISLLCLISLIGLIVHDMVRFNDGKLHIIFCNIGQGDAIFIRTPAKKNILVDGGPDRSVLDCLGRHMPFWERTIDLMVLTHPHQDHLVGLYYALQQYSVLSFDTERLGNNTTSFTSLLEKIHGSAIPLHYRYAGDSLKIGDGVSFTVLSPSIGYLQETSPNGSVGERAEFASLVMKVSFGSFDVILTGDSQANILHRVLRKNDQNHLEVIQVPHHGSKTGFDKDMIRSLRPDMAIISVGKNIYGHPNKDLINYFEQSNVRVFRTDIRGDIELVSDGIRWGVK
jgi:competence protein ComEC